MTDPDAELHRRLAALSPDKRQRLLAQMGLYSATAGDGSWAQKRLELSILLKRALAEQSCRKTRQLH